jgi:hypothetical protein
MTFDLATARRYLKADGPDDDVITNMLSQVQAICEGYCNRRFYATEQAMSDDFIEALTDRADALAARATQLSAIVGSDADSMGTRGLIRDHYIEVLGRISQRIHGIPIDSDVEAAMFLTLGHLYVNREDNVVSGNNAVQLPVGAQRILQPKLWIGDLADDSSGDVYPCGS